MKKRIAEPGKRHRADNGPASLEVTPIPPPSQRDLGQSHLYTAQIIQGGPRAVIAAQREAQRLSAKFGEEIEAKWCLATPWLLQMAKGSDDALFDAANASSDADDTDYANPVTDSTDASSDVVSGVRKQGFSASGLPRKQGFSAARQVRGQRERARYALSWRPRFLAVVSLTRSSLMACRAARVSRDTVRRHRRCDPDFDAQVMTAQDMAVELLQDVAMRRAIEGDCKPIYWQGIIVGHERVYSDKIQIEMLRAYRPDRFHTPGVKLSINNNNPGGTNLLIFDTPVLQKVQEMRQESLRRLAEKKARAREVTALPLGMTAPEAVPPTR